MRETSMEDSTRTLSKKTFVNITCNLDILVTLPFMYGKVPMGGSTRGSCCDVGSRVNPGQGPNACCCNVLGGGRPPPTFGRELLLQGGVNPPMLRSGWCCCIGRLTPP